MTPKSPDLVDKHIGRRIRALRVILGMSQEKLAEALGITFQQVQKYENGTNRVSAGRLHHLASVLGVPVGRFYEDAYLAGIVAGGMTKSNTLGFVASYPIPEVIRNINAYTLGAQTVNPKIRTKVVWINSWFDPPKETEAAQALMNQGADVLLQNTDSAAVLQAAEKAGKYAFGWDSDMSAFAPRAHLASCVLHWDVYYDKAIGDVLNGTWKTGSFKWGIKEGANDFVKLSDAIPAEIKQKVEEAKGFLKENPGAVFRGPIVDNTGKEQLAKDQVGDEEFKGQMKFYVKGVEGRVPGSN